MIGHQEDLAAASFVALRNSLAEPGGAPLPFTLRPKASTQDDPFDVYLCERLEKAFPGRVQGAPGPLISPDMVVVAAEVEPNAVTTLDTTQACGIEVKRFKKLSSRSTGMDFNTTPPMRHDQGLQQPLSKDRDSRFLCVRCRRDHRRQECGHYPHPCRRRCHQQRQGTLRRRRVAKDERDRPRRVR